MSMRKHLYPLLHTDKLHYQLFDFKKQQDKEPWLIKDPFMHQYIKDQFMHQYNNTKLIY